MAENTSLPIGSDAWFAWLSGQFGYSANIPSDPQQLQRWRQNMQSRYGWALTDPRYGNPNYVPGGTGNTQTQYSPPHETPTTLGEYEENLLSNQGFQARARGEPLGMDAALLYALLGSRQANEDTEKDFQAAKGSLYESRDLTRGLLEGAGKTELEDEERMYAKERAGLDQDLISRGLYSTTTTDAMRNRLTESSGRRREQIRRGTAMSQVGNENLYGQLISGLHGQRQRDFSGNVYQNLATAAGAGRTGPSSGDRALQIAGTILPWISSFAAARGGGSGSSSGYGSWSR